MRSAEAGSLALAALLAVLASPAAAASPVAANGPVEYQCTEAGGGNDTLIATFYQTQPTMALIVHHDEARPAFQVPAASGARYEGQDVTFWDAHGEATVTWSGSQLECRPRRR